MPGTNNERQDAANSRQKQSKSGLRISTTEIEGLVKAITFEGNLAALIASACETASIYQTPSHADPGQAPHPGVQAAIRAYADWKRTKEGSMNMEVRPRSAIIEPPVGEPEILPLSLAGKWVAWSSDGMRIVASSESSEEAERLAIAAGESEPILERHPGRHRL